MAVNPRPSPVGAARPDPSEGSEIPRLSPMAFSDNSWPGAAECATSPHPPNHLPGIVSSSSAHPWLQNGVGTRTPVAAIAEIGQLHPARIPNPLTDPLPTSEIPQAPPGGEGQGAYRKIIRVHRGSNPPARCGTGRECRKGGFRDQRAKRFGRGRAGAVEIDERRPAGPVKSEPAPSSIRTPGRKNSRRSRLPHRAPSRSRHVQNEFGTR